MANEYDDDLNDDNFVVEFPRRQAKVRKRWPLALAAILVSGFVLASVASTLYLDLLWFDSLGYGSVYRTQLGWQTGLWFLGFVVGTAFALAILTAARRVMSPGGETPFEAFLPPEYLREIRFVSGSLYRLAAGALAAFAGYVVATGVSKAWPTIAVWLNSLPTGVRDPIFDRDLSFFFFALPAYQLIASVVTALGIVGVIIAAVAALASRAGAGPSPSAMTRDGASFLSAAAAVLAVAFAAQAWLARYELAFEEHANFSGVSYASHTVRMPALAVLAAVLLLAALVLAYNAVAVGRLKPIILAAGAVAVVWILGVNILPGVVYAFSVKPNELAREAPYIANNIAATRAAFALDRFTERPFETNEVSAADLSANQATVDSIPLWDWQALSPTLKQRQQIRAYYDFPDVDIDRYSIDGRVRQVMLSPRELSLEQLPPASRTWINERLIYTHGYGVTMSSVNEFTRDGAPEFLLRDIPVVSASPSISVTKPEIYYGELTSGHAFVRTRQPDLSEAPPDAVTQSEYTGTGIPVGGLLRRLAIAWRLGDVNEMLLSDYLEPESLLLMRRDVMDRVRALAPFLIFDTDPYIVIRDDGTISWIIDAFSVTTRYPNARRLQAGDVGMNYVRNSVKVTIDANTGETKFYVFEPDDPIIGAYARVFPDLLAPRENMPEDLRRHVRYPEYLVERQAAVYTLYHMTSVQEFYNREDLWSVATDARPSQEQAREGRPLDPYYVLMQLPGESVGIEFVSILPFTPVNRQNMTAWFAARSDGDNYGHAIIYRFPTSRLVTGPSQVEARISQDPTISSTLALWNQQGSKVIRGNMLVVPVGAGLLFVEPIFLQAARGPMPELRMVVLATEERLVFGNRYEDALAALFPAGAPREERQPGGQPAPADPAGAVGDTAGPGTATDRTALVRDAAAALEEYQRRTAAGEHAEAGRALDRLKATLDRLSKTP